MPDNAYRSGSHRKVEEVLDRMGVDYTSEVSFPPYGLDIYLHDTHLGIEVDGPGHHAKHDNTKDAWLEERFGLRIMRIKVKGPWNTKGKLEKEITEFLEEYGHNIEERKAKWLQTMR